MRSGLIAEKIGMTQVFEPNGNQVPVTVLKVSPCTVIERKNQDVHGYDAVQLGTHEVSPNKLAKPQREYFAKKNLTPLFSRVQKIMQATAIHEPALFPWRSTGLKIRGSRNCIEKQCRHSIYSLRLF